EAPQERGQRDRRLEPRERGADAEVDPVPEREMAAVAAAEVEAVRLVEPLGIAVRGAREGEHEVARADGLAAQHDRPSCAAAKALDRAVVTEQLLDGARGESRVPSQALELGRVPEQGEQAVPDQVRGRLVAGEEERDARRDELVLR